MFGISTSVLIIPSKRRIILDNAFSQSSTFWPGGLLFPKTRTRCCGRIKTIVAPNLSGLLVFTYTAGGFPDNPVLRNLPSLIILDLNGYSLAQNLELVKLPPIS
jgi:hypothetical protein